MSLTLERVTVTRHGRPLIGPLSLRVAPGEIVTVMGPSGAGKSTLLDVITGTLAPAFRAGGQVILDGRDLTGLAPEARAVGLLFQDPMLFPHLSVAGNLAFGMPRGIRRAERRDRVEAALSEAGLAGLGGARSGHPVGRPGGAGGADAGAVVGAPRPVAGRAVLPPGRGPARPPAGFRSGSCGAAGPAGGAGHP